MQEADERERNLTNTSHNVKWVVCGSVIHVLIKQQTIPNKQGNSTVFTVVYQQKL